MARLFKELLHANGPPKIWLRDKIKEEFWGQKVTTIDYPFGIEINKQGFINEIEFQNIQEGLAYLTERENLINQDDQFQKSVAKKYNGSSLLKLHEQQKKLIKYQQEHKMEEVEEEEVEEMEEEEEEEDINKSEYESEQEFEIEDEGDNDDDEDDLELKEIKEHDFSI